MLAISADAGGIQGTKDALLAGRGGCGRNGGGIVGGSAGRGGRGGGPVIEEGGELVQRMALEMVACTDAFDESRR